MTPDISAIAQTHKLVALESGFSDEQAEILGRIVALAASEATASLTAERERIQKAIYCTEEEGVYEVPSDPGPTECDSLAEAVEAYVRIMNRGFEEDAKRIRAADEATASLRAQLEQRWIPVSERLPEPETEVMATGLAFDGREPGRFTTIAVQHATGQWSAYNFMRDNYTQPIYTPTHWMPLPAAPESPLNGKEGK